MPAPSTTPPISLEQLGELGRLIGDLVEQRVQAALAAVSTSEDGWLDGIDAIAEYLGCPRSRLYDITYRRETGIPLYKDGRSWVAKRSELDAWRRGSA